MLEPPDANYQSSLQGLTQALTSRGADAAQAASQAQGVLYGMVQQQAMMKAFVDVFWMLSLVFLAMIPLVFLMRRVQPHKVAVVVE